MVTYRDGTGGSISTCTSAASAPSLSAVNNYARCPRVPECCCPAERRCTAACPRLCRGGGGGGDASLGGGVSGLDRCANGADRCTPVPSRACDIAITQCEQRWIEGWYPAPISSWHGNIQGWYRRQQQQHKLTIGGVLFWSLPACRPAALPPSRPAIFIRDYVKKSGRHPPKLVRSLYPPAKAPPVRREPQRAHVLALRDAESVPVRGLVNIKGTHGAPWWRSARAAQHYLVPVTIHRRRHMWRRHSGSSPRRKSADSYSLARLLLHTGWHIAR
jgi:hypothetical protein